MSKLSAYLDAPIIDSCLKLSAMVLEKCCEEDRPNQVIIEAYVNQLASSIYASKSTRTSVSRVLFHSLRVRKDAIRNWRIIQPSDYPGIINALPTDPTVAFFTHEGIKEPVREYIQAYQRGMHDIMKVSPEPSRVLDALLACSLDVAKEEMWAELVDNAVVRSAHSTAFPFVVKTNTFSAVISSGLCYLYSRNSQIPSGFLMWNQILMFRDCLKSRLNVLLASYVMYPLDDALRRSMRGSFAWQEECLRRYGNEGYDLVKSVEALAKVHLIHIADGEYKSSRWTLDNMITKINTKERKLDELVGYTGEQREGLADRYERTVITGVTTIQQATELFGMQRMTGFPLIDPLRASKKSKLTAQAPDRSKVGATRVLRASFRRLFLLGYLKRNKKWPRLRFLRKDTVLYALYMNDRLDISNATLTDDDLMSFDFTQIFEFNDYEDFTELLDDKSVSLSLREKHMTWDGGKPTTSQRLLLDILSKRDFSLPDVIKLFDNDRVPIEWFIASLYPKEREFKIEARAFTMFVAEVRSFFAACESNLADAVVPLVGGITMVDSKLSIKERFHMLTVPPTDPSILQFFLELDLSAWNLVWRSMAVYGPGIDLNRMFGKRRVFTTIHTFLSKACIMMRTRDCRPEGVERLWPPESDLVHYNHLGGLEGIAQKLWSLCTMAVADAALRPLGVQYINTEQGDNIVIRVRTTRDDGVDEDTQYRATATRVLEACQDGFAAVNQDLKPEECVVSRRVLTYSKEVFVDGIQYPTTLKDLSRVIPIVSQNFPSLRSALGSISSTCYAAALNARSPMRCLELSVLHRCMYLFRSYRSGSEINAALASSSWIRTAEGMSFLLTFPEELGGACNAGPYAFLYRGGADPLSKSLASLKLMQDHYPMARSIIAWIASRRGLDRSCTVSKLIKDPYSIPFSTPVGPSEAVSQPTLEYVKATAKNPSFTSVFRSDNRRSRQEFFNILSSLTPFNPMIAHDLYDCSIFGSIDRLQRLFLLTSTVQRVARLDPESEILGRAERAANNEIVYLKTTLKSLLPSEMRIPSLYQFVEAARGCWSTLGIKVTNITAYLPIDFPIVINPPSQFIGVLAEYLPTAESGVTPIELSRAFRGKETTAKVSEHGYRIVGRGHVNAALRKVASMYAWSDSSKEVTSLVDWISRSCSPINISQYAGRLAGVGGGTAAHRYSARMAEMGASYLGHDFVSSNIILSSNRAGFLSGSTDDYKVMFQEFFLYLTAIISMMKSSNSKLGFVQVLSEVGVSPLDAVTPESFSIPVRCDLLPTVPPSPLSYISSVDLRRVRGISDSMSASLPKVSRGYPIVAAVRESFSRVIPTWELQSYRQDLIGRTRLNTLDLIEVNGLGIDQLLSVSAYSVWWVLLQVERSPSLSGSMRRSQLLTISTMARSVYDSLHSILNHPSIRADKAFQRWIGSSSLRYSSLTSERENFVAEVCRRVVENRQDKSSFFYRTSLTVFSSSPLRGFIQAHYQAVRINFARLYLSRSITDQEMTYAVGSIIKYSKHPDDQTDQEKLARLKLSLEGLASRKFPIDPGSRAVTGYSGASIALANQLADNAADISVDYMDEDSRVVLRSLRKLPSRVRRPLPLVLPFRQGDLVLIPVGTMNTTRSRATTRADIYKERARQNKGRIINWGCSAFSSWGILSDCFKDLRVLCIGSGMGGAAAAALQGGATSVLGHDLRRDLPSFLTLSEYKPLLVEKIHQDLKYLQTTASRVGNGDWNDAATLQSLQASSRNTDIIIVDIQGEEDLLWSNAAKASERFPNHPIFVRAVGPLSSTEQMCTAVRMISKASRMCLIQRSASRTETIFHMTPPYNAIDLRIPRTDISSVACSPPRQAVNTRSFLEAAALWPLALRSDRSFSQDLATALSEFSIRLKIKSAREDYETWTSALETYLGVWLLSHWKRREWISVSASLAVDEEITLSSWGDLKIKNTPSLRHKFFSVVMPLMR